MTCLFFHHFRLFRYKPINFWFQKTVLFFLTFKIFSYRSIFIITSSLLNRRYFTLNHVVIWFIKLPKRLSNKTLNFGICLYVFKTTCLETYYQTIPRQHNTDNMYVYVSCHVVSRCTYQQNNRYIYSSVEVHILYRVLFAIYFLLELINNNTCFLVKKSLKSSMYFRNFRVV